MLMMTPYSDIYKKLFNKAVQVLAHRNHASMELKQKLTAFYNKNFYDPDTNDNKQQMDELLEKVISDCTSRNWLDDLQYTKQYIVMRSNKGYGRSRIILELKQRGIERELIYAVIDQQSIDWVTMGIKVINKKFNQIEPSNLKQKIKIYQFLSYRGFSQEEHHLIYQSICTSQQ